MQNPFRFGSVVSGEDFADRRRELAELGRELAPGQHVFLLSPRRYGKTSLILTLLGRLRAQGLLTAYVDVFRATTAAQLLELTALVVGQRNEDVPSRGRFWIDPVDGRILRTLFETRPIGGVNTIEVRFRYEPRLDILVPGEMIERRYAGAEIVEGKATYSNFRRFRVDT